MERDRPELRLEKLRLAQAFVSIEPTGRQSILGSSHVKRGTVSGISNAAAVSQLRPLLVSYNARE